MEDLSLLVVDVCDGWEDVLKNHERGYSLEWDCLSGGRWKLSYFFGPLGIEYLHGSVRAGFNAIIDTVRIARDLGRTVYSAELYDGFSDGEEATCSSLQPYIPEKNRFEKRGYSAFGSKDFVSRMESDNCRHLMVLGYDCDCCVLETIKDAVRRGIEVVTSEHIMLTASRHLNLRREETLRYMRANTTFLESLVDVWNYLYK